ncbi:protein turtle-like isoform X2 [Centruroides sculpturatus]|uniref:protein turtle-like isoform X2 n=1 Tax=Centruroides sculpturatus TaxID=218467 RepID=UPI000C6D85BC|nr:protein turtle-like isoform X2 [Centruroides sculpturatus]
MIWRRTCLFLTSFVSFLSFTAEDAEHVTAILGEDVILHCAFKFPEDIPVPYVIQWQKQGIKIPIYIWYDGYPPHAGKGYDGRVSLSGQASLNLSNVQQSDQGWYECKVYFLNRPPDSPKNGTWVNLKVQAPPRFTVKPPDVLYVKTGQSVILQCEAEGTPQPKIFWYKDNLPLDESANIKVTNTTVRITNLKQTDIGDYLCTAHNIEGSASAHTKIIVAGSAVITLPPRNATKLEGDGVELICEAKAFPSNITHHWYYNGIDISELSWLESRTNIRRDGTLFINPTSAEDTGLYTCEVSNGIGNPNSASAYLNVEYPARVTYSPTIQYLPLGLSGIVKCYIQASPPFQHITWTKDQRPFDPHATPGVSTLNNGSLFFQHVNIEYQGRYQCTPYNIHGTAGTSNEMEILVREPSVFTIKPKPIYQKTVNMEVTMPCSGTGQPKPLISWRRADAKKLPRDRTEVIGGNLTIRGLRKEDHGTYECVLENEIATLVTSSLLLIESTTPHAPTNLSVNTSAFAATLSWLPAYDGGYEQNYVIWYRLKERDENDWRTIHVQPKGVTTFTIYNLQSNAEYDFQILSRNILGDGQFSPIVKAKTKEWDYLGGVYPTDAYGATYIPTVQKPAGPKPWPPRNVTITNTPHGVLISWLPPMNKSIPVAFYYVEYKTEDRPWKRWEPVKDENSYLAKGLPAGYSYYFRVFSYSIMSVGSPSEEVIFFLPTEHGATSRSKAITAGVVGGAVFFIVASILSVCAVKICNKRKRRKTEKAYIMVTCPVGDGRKEGHSHERSPVPHKNTYSRFKESCVPCVIITTLRRIFSGISHALRFNLAQRRYSNSIHQRNVENVQDWSCGYVSRTLPSSLPGRRFPKTAHYSLEFEYSQPLGWISRTAEGKFVVGGKDDGRFACITPTNNFILSNHPSSYENNSRYWDKFSPQFFSQHSPPFRSGNVPFSSVHSSRRYLFRTSSPGPLAAGPFVLEDLSSVNPSSAERSFPSTVSSHFASTIAPHTPSYELPSFQMVNSPHIHLMRGQFKPIQKYKAQSDINFPLMKAMPQTPHHHHLLNEQIHLHPQTGRSVHKDERSMGDKWPDVPLENVHAPNVYYPPHKQNQSKEQKPLATSSPPQPERRIAYVPPTQAKGTTTLQGISRETNRNVNNYPMTYTRERLLGAVERVRRGVIHRNDQQFTLPKMALPKPISSVQTGIRPTTHSPSRIQPGHNIERPNAMPRCRISVTSSSSGQGSSVQDSKPTSLSHSHSHQDSLQGEFDISAMNHSNCSSGFASRNVSNINTSLSQRYPTAVPHFGHPSSDFISTALDSPHSEPSMSHHGAAFEFKPHHTEKEPGKLQTYRQTLPSFLSQSARSDRGFSDSEIDTNFYPQPKRLSKYDNTEARCAALKEEFMKFRQRQKERRKSEEQESSC